jgi:hypothetical protein
MIKAKIMAWMTMWPYAADVERPGRLTPINASAKTSNVNLAGCTEPWSSSMDPRSASLGRVILTRLRSASQSLTASQSYLALELVGISTAPIPTMSLVTTRVKQQIERK